jgi:hypothetical protein
MITTLDYLPEGLLELPASELHQRIGDHTLIHLDGKIKRPVFVSILQHGDEHTGWDALRDYLRNHLQHGLTRSLIILFGNIQAAAINRRKLPGQPDFNRRWPGHRIPDDAIARRLQEITECMRQAGLFASVDIHNNSGRNPHYSGINRLDRAFVNLASLFSSRMIHFTSPDGIQSSAFSRFCPAITVESGQSGTADGREQTHTFLELLMTQTNLDHVPGILEHPQVYRVFGTVKVRPERPFVIGEQPSPDSALFVIKKDLDFLNFHQVEAGTVFGWAKNDLPLQVLDQDDKDITDQWFTLENDSVRLKHSAVPAMITQKPQAIIDDSLCYLMQPVAREELPLSTLEVNP